MIICDFSIFFIIKLSIYQGAIFEGIMFGAQQSS